MNERDNSGILFRNDKEGGNPNWPDYKGTCTVNGQEFWLSAWIKTGKNGKFMSLAFTPKEERPVTRTKRPAQVSGSFDDMDDDIPF